MARDLQNEGISRSKEMKMTLYFDKRLILYLIFSIIYLVITSLVLSITKSFYLCLLLLLPAVASCIILITSYKIESMDRRFVIFAKWLCPLSAAVGAFSSLLIAFFIEPAIGLALLFLIILPATLIELNLIERIARVFTERISTGTIIAKVRYYHDNKLVRENWFTTSMFSIIIKDRIRKKDSFRMPICDLDYSIINMGNEYGLIIDPRMIIPSNFLKNVVGGRLLLQKINIYVDGALASSVTFYEDSPPNQQLLLPIIESTENRFSFPIPLVIGIPEGSHVLVVEFIDNLGRVLCMGEKEFEIFEWMKEGRIWNVITAEVTRVSKSTRFTSPKNYIVYYKEDSLTSVTELEGNRISVSSLNIDAIPGLIKGIEFTLTVFDHCSFDSIEVRIDDGDGYDIILERPICLCRNYQYTFRIPRLPILLIKKGKNTLMLKFKQTFILRLFRIKEYLEQAQEIHTYMTEIIHPEEKDTRKRTRKPRKTIKRRSKKEVNKELTSQADTR